MSWIDIELDTSWLYTMTHSFVCVSVCVCLLVCIKSLF